MLLAAVTGVARALPLAAGYRIADLLSEGHRVFSVRRRDAVQGNLRVLRGEAEDLSGLTAEVFRNYGRFLFEFLRGPDVAEVEHVFERWEELEAAREEGRGVILPVLHTGNWEITGARLARAGVPVHAVAGTQLTRSWTRELRRRQESAGIRILPPTIASWRDIPRLLARNEALALLVDGNVYRQALPVPLCGRRAVLPAGPARLAGRTGAALLPIYCFRRDTGQLGARFLRRIPVTDGAPDTVRRATEAMAAQFEGVLRQLPGQWLIFRRFFGEALGENGDAGMRIAVVTQPYYPQNGGVSENVHHTTTELRKLGHEVHVVTSRFRTATESADGVFRVGRNVLLPHLGALANVNAGFGLRREMRRIYARQEYDVVHVHEPMSPTLPLVAIEEAPTDAAVVGTYHASSRRGVAYRMGQPFLRRFNNRLDARVAVSHAARRFAARYFDEGFEVVPNGVDPSRFHPKVAPLEEHDSDRPTILFVGRFYPRKGVPVLLRALASIAKRVPDVRLLVVGGGLLEPWYRILAQRVPCEVRFLGELSWADIPRAYRTADVFVAPSTGSESFGIVHLEAMASGIPIVASDIEGYREILDPGREALLFPNRDAPALADAVVRILRDPHLARSMSVAGRRKAERYAWSEIARRLESLYLGLVSRERMPLAS